MKRLTYILLTAVLLLSFTTPVANDGIVATTGIRATVGIQATKGINVITADGLHPETQWWVDRIEANGGTVEGTTIAYVDAFVWDVYEKEARAKFYRYNPFLGSDFQAAQVPLFVNNTGVVGEIVGYPVDTAYNYISGNYGETTGMKGHGTFYLNTGFSDTVNTTQNMMFGVAVENYDYIIGIRAFLGVNATNTDSYIAPITTGSPELRLRINRRGDLRMTPSDTTKFMVSTSRSIDNTQIGVINNDQSESTFQNFSFTSPLHFHVLGVNFRGSNIPSFHTLSGYWIGTGINKDTESLKALHDCINALLANFNRNVY